MSPELSQRFMKEWPAIKAGWLQRLRDEPLLSPLGRADTIVFLMDATLQQLQAGLESGPGWLEHCTPVVSSVHRHCACGFNPVVKYFSTGEEALHAAVSETYAADFDEIIGRFRALARHEVGALCGDCIHPDWPGCALRQTTPPP